MSLISKKPATKYSFNGSFDLDNIEGKIYEDLAQSAALVLSVASAKTGGFAFVSVVANGDAITVPGSWVNVSTESISIVTTDTNHISVWCLGPDKIHYGVKVV